jgi:protoporphyrinogen/coproporphyrinogen III oxidase
MNAPVPAVPAVIIGGGISGLACAYALRKAGIDAVILESADRPGGVIQSVQRDGYLLEFGPQTFSAAPSLRQLCGEFGIADQLVPAPARSPRFVFIDGQLRLVPLSALAFFTSPLFGPATKWGIVRDLIGHSYPPDGEESLAAFVRRKFSAELLEKLAAPFASGIYAGDPEKLSMQAAFPQIYEAEKSAGSVIRGIMHAAKAKPGPRVRPSLVSFRDGNETLVRALAQTLGTNLRIHTTVRRIRTASAADHAGASSAAAGPNAARYIIECESSGVAQTIATNAVIVATPTQAAADLLSEVAPAAAEALRRIQYAPVAVVSLGYAATAVGRSLEGFGFLVPRSAGLRILGTVWNSSLFPGRAPAGHVLLTSFVGGATDPAAVNLTPEELVALVHRELTPILQFSAAPIFSNVTRWPRAIPQYNLGHTARLESISSALADHPGVFLTGNYVVGPALAACIENAQSVARFLRSHLPA